MVILPLNCFSEGSPRYRMFRGTDPPFVALQSPKGSEAPDKTPLTFSEWLRTANFGEERVYFAGLDCGCSMPKDDALIAGLTSPTLHLYLDREDDGGEQG